MADSTKCCQVLRGSAGQGTSTTLLIDGMVRKMCWPIRHQREVFNGHHWVHSPKFQSVVIPNGLTANLFGPMSGWRHDAALFNNSGIPDHMVTNMNGPDGQHLTVYSDPAYPLTSNVIHPFPGLNLSEEQQAFNTAMSKVRQSVEWEFGKVVRMWAFLDFEKNLKLFLSPVGKLYMVGVLLTNCHTCLRGSKSKTSQYFGLNPPTLEEYLYWNLGVHTQILRCLCSSEKITCHHDKALCLQCNTEFGNC